MEISFIFAIILAIIFMIILPIIFIIFNKNNAISKTITIIFGCIYFIVLLIGVTCQFSISNGIINIYYSTNNSSFDLAKFTLYDFGTFNVFINLFMLIPIGALFVIKQKDKPMFWQCAITSLLISITIEFLQLALPISRSVELTDLLFNTISGIIGYLLFFCVEKITLKYKNFKY